MASTISFLNPSSIPNLIRTRVKTQTSRLSSRSMSQLASVSPPNDSVTSSKDDTSQAEIADVTVQYVVLRRDLIDTWPLGSVVTQGCHASVSAVWNNKDDPHTVDYCSPEKIDSMHKVWFIVYFFLFVVY